MSSRAENEKQKQIQEKCQIILGNLLREEDNKYCVDCDAKGPRWASWNLGIFLCIRCAGIHRNLGVHISKVKSVNLDTWTPEQVAYLQQMGNSQARAVYEANLPDSFRRPQIDSSLETFIRQKYEQKKYIAKEWVPPPAPKPAFDIEEEKKRQKERKKTRARDSANIEIPVLPQHPAALPRPHSAVQTPPLKNVTQDVSPSAASQNDSSNTADLLNLGDPSANVQTNSDIFDAFLGASPVPTSTSIPDAPTNAAESVVTSSSNCTYSSENLFSQIAAPAQAQNKMSKESILSLYGSSQTQSNVPVPPAYGIAPGRMYIAQPSYAQVTVARYPAVPDQAVPNGIPGMVAHIPNVQQVQQQMANLQLQGQVWTASGMGLNAHVPPNMVLGTDTGTGGTAWPLGSQGHTLSNNLWQ